MSTKTNDRKRLWTRLAVAASNRDKTELFRIRHQLLQMLLTTSPQRPRWRSKHSTRRTPWASKPAKQAHPQYPPQIDGQKSTTLPSTSSLHGSSAGSQPETQTPPHPPKP